MKYLLPIFFVLLSMNAFADIGFWVNQSDYYFKTGNNAIVDLHMNNTYPGDVRGQLTHTIDQEIYQGGNRVFQSNTNSKPFVVKKGETSAPVNFGKTDTPMTLDVNLKFVYEKEFTKEINLDFKVHFVEEQSKKQNKQQKTESSSKRQNEELPKEKDPSQKLQNNQLQQDTSQLKRQMQEQMKDQKGMQESFQNELMQNEKLQNAMEKLEQKGFNMTDIKLKATGNKSGEFELKYNNSMGENASIKGRMENSTITEMEVEDKKEFNYWWLFVIIFSVGVLYLAYVLGKKEEPVASPKLQEDFDYVSFAKKMLNEAEYFYRHDMQKDAFAKLAQGIRLYYSHKHGLKKELTNDEVANKVNDEGIKKILEICTLVEFAKYEPKNEFLESFKHAKEIIK